MADHRFRLVRALAVGLVALSTWACGAEEAGLGGTGTPPNPPVPVDACADPAEGCPCSSAGETALCGKISQTYDDYIVCSQGVTTCDGTRWSACVENGTTYTRSLSGLDLANLAPSPGPCVNACSPSCSTYVDTPSGLDAGVDSGLIAIDGGLSLEPKPATTQSSCTSLTITPNKAPGKDIAVTDLSATNAVTFTATLAPAGCFTGTINPLWSIDRFDIAQISDTGRLTLVTPIAGPIVVRAFVGTLSGTVTSNVTINVTARSTTNAPPASLTASSFPSEGGTTVVDADLETLYPYANTVFPLGLAPPLVQWRNLTAATGVLISLRYPAGSATPLYRYSELASESQTFPVPLRTAQPRARINEARWTEFEQSVNRNRATHGDTADIVVRRLVAGVARASKTIPIKFAAGQLKGRVYYNSYGTSLVRNYSGAQQSTNGAFPGGQFGAATLAVVPGEAQPSIIAGATGCRVCHSANASGSVLVTAEENNYNIYKYALPGASAAGTYLSNKKLVFPAVNPDASRYFSSAGAYSGDSKSTLYDGNAATISGATNFTDLKAGFPVFAHDGRAVAFTFRGGSSAPLGNETNGGHGGVLAMMSFDGNRTFSSFRKLHTPANTALGERTLAAWPSFLPAGQNGIVFQREIRTTPNGGFGYTRSDCDNTGTCNDQGATGELWWVSTDASPVATRLHNLNGWNTAGTTGTLPAGANRHLNGASPDGIWYEQVYNYEPSVLPVTIGGYSWVAFTSRRMYGNVATINPYSSDPRYRNISIDPTPKKLWLAAISANPAKGTDPSAPSFYLPGQELIAGNSRAVFALDSCKVAGPPTSSNLCDSDLDCCGAPSTAACVLDPPPLANPPTRHCVALSGLCKAAGEQCTQDAQCCNFASGERCASGTCQQPPPIYFDATYTRDYVATCGPGERPIWRLFEWQSTTPVGTSIVFRGQTRELLTDSWVPATPVSLGTAAAPPVSTAGWTNGGATADARLRSVGEFSRSWLRVFADLKASADRTLSPTLREWRATYDCVAAE